MEMVAALKDAIFRQMNCIVNGVTF